MSRRRYTAAPDYARCQSDITLRDGSGAQCMRRAARTGLCEQHARIKDAWWCEWCGTGHDESPPGHTADCENPDK